MSDRAVRRRFSSLAAIVAIALIAHGAGAAEAPVDVPVVGPLTGPTGLLGQSMQRGLRVLEAHVNRTGGIRGRPLRFVYYDDQGQPQIAVQVLDQLKSRGSNVVLGSMASANCRAMMPLVDKGPVMYCFSPSLEPPAGSYAFTAGLNATFETQAAMRFFAGHGWTRIALLTTSDAAGSDGDNATLKAAAADHAMQIVAHERFAPDALSVTAQLARIRPANPQVMVIWGSPNVLATAIHSMNDAGFDLPTLTVDSVMVYGLMKQLAPFLPSQMFFASTGWDGAAVLKAGPQRTNLINTLSLMNAAGIVPDSWATEPWDAATIVIDALRKLGPEAPASAIRASIASLHGYYGIMGPYDFRSGDQRGLSARDVVIYRWANEQSDWRPVSLPGGAPLRT